ncbi:MAG: 50S ribosomal protein L5 [Candidatus Nanohalarchaeota archaeon]|nr:MAG: 50S ribosomal protein L5 [Candidatus Nanohaloarchaeota archaeon]
MPDKNQMTVIYTSKVTLSISTGEPGESVEKAYTLAERLTSQKPVRTLATRKARTFRIRRGLPIGVKVTMRKEKGIEFLKKILPGIGNHISPYNFDNNGNFSFGIKEYLSIPGQKYDPKLGMIGMNINITLERPGYRIKRRKIKKAKISKSHRITKEEAIEYAKTNLKIQVM